VRTLDDRSNSLGQTGAEIVTGGLLDIESVCKALKGDRERLFLLPHSARDARSSRGEAPLSIREWLKENIALVEALSLKALKVGCALWRPTTD
jgi:hypothetical protein